jgi:hypothetical protein
VNAPEAFFSYNLKPAGLTSDLELAAHQQLLLEAGAAERTAAGQSTVNQRSHATTYSIVEQSTGMRYNSGTPTFGPLYYTTQLVPRSVSGFSASYVTGGHNVKGGFYFEGKLLEIEAENGTNNVEYAFNNQVPVSVTQWATPYGLKAENRDFAFYIQDQWTLQRLTLTYGLRYEYFNGYVPAQHVDATPNGWVPERNFDEGQERPELEGCRSQDRRGLRCLWQRQDSYQGGYRPLRRQDGYHHHEQQQPDPDLDQLGQPHLERQLVSGGRSTPR